MKRSKEHRRRCRTPLAGAKKGRKNGRKRKKKNGGSRPSQQQQQQQQQQPTTNNQQQQPTTTTTNKYIKTIKCRRYYSRIFRRGRVWGLLRDNAIKRFHTGSVSELWPLAII